MSVEYKDNINLEENLLQDYLSEEIENKFRFEKILLEKMVGK